MLRSFQIVTTTGLSPVGLCQLVWTRLELPKDQYQKIKSKLVSELADILKKEKRIFSLLEVIGKAADFGAKKPTLAKAEYLAEDKKPIEEAFTKTTSLVLGKGLTGIDLYSDFLQRHVMKTLITKSPLSGEKTLTCGYVRRFLGAADIRKRLLSEEEIWAIGSLHISEDRLQKLKLDPDFLAELLKDIAYASYDGKIGTNTNMINTAITLSSNDCYEGGSIVFSKKCAFDYWPDRSDHIFGSALVFSSSFCINSYNSKQIARSFEIDSCQNCSGIYYCHNVENVQDAFFCFNTKSIRHAIGNAELPQDTYNKIRSALLEQIAFELEKNKTLKWDIYSLSRPNAPD